MVTFNPKWYQLGGLGRLQERSHKLHRHWRAHGVLLPGGLSPSATRLPPAEGPQLEAVCVAGGCRPSASAPAPPSADTATEGARQLPSLAMKELPPSQPVAEPPQTAGRDQPLLPGPMWPRSVHAPPLRRGQQPLPAEESQTTPTVDELPAVATSAPCQPEPQLPSPPAQLALGPPAQITDIPQSRPLLAIQDVAHVPEVSFGQQRQPLRRCPPFMVKRGPEKVVLGPLPLPAPPRPVLAPVLAVHRTWRQLSRPVGAGAEYSPPSGIPGSPPSRAGACASRHTARGCAWGSGSQQQPSGDRLSSRGGPTGSL